jgi:hypothetical protein
MSVAYQPGQTLTQDDLKILIRDNIGNLVDPYYIRFSIFDYTTGVEVLIGPPDQIPATMGVGQYYVNSTIPLDANIGDWLVRWNFRETSGSPTIQVIQEFNIVAKDVKTDITTVDSEQLLVKRLRIILRDNNPDRNYRFRPPSSEKFIQAQAQVFGYVWEDYELYEYLLMAVDYFNTAPPVTGITLYQTPDRWRAVLLLKASSIACGALALNWIVDEYSVIGDERLIVKDGAGIEYNLTIKELYDVVYGQMMSDICREVDMDVKESLALIRSWEDEDKQTGTIN